MKDFKNKGGFRKDRNSGGFNRGPGGFRGSEGRSFDRPQLFPAVCDKCGKSCEVPFKPTGQRPVFCRECFGANKGGAPMGGSERRDYSAPPQTQVFAPKAEDRRIDDIKRQLDSLNSKLDKLITVMESANHSVSTPKAAKSAPKTVKKAKAVKKKK